MAKINSTEAAAIDKNTTTISPSGRDLPIFCNHLLTQKDAHTPSLNSHIIAGNGKSFPIVYVKVPTPQGEISVLRRLDTNYVNATQLFRAAYPMSPELEQKEMVWLESECDVVILTGPKLGKLAGTWVPLSTAESLAKDYGLEKFVTPLLNQESFTKNLTQRPKATERHQDGELHTQEVGIDESSAQEEDIPAVDGNSPKNPVQKDPRRETVVGEKKDGGVKVDSDTRAADPPLPAKRKLENFEEDAGCGVIISPGIKRRLEQLENEVKAERRKVRALFGVAVGLTATTVLPYLFG